MCQMSFNQKQLGHNHVLLNVETHPNQGGFTKTEIYRREDQQQHADLRSGTTL